MRWGLIIEKQMLFSYPFVKSPVNFIKSWYLIILFQKIILKIFQLEITSKMIFLIFSLFLV